MFGFINIFGIGRLFVVFCSSSSSSDGFICKRKLEIYFWVEKGMMFIFEERCLVLFKFWNKIFGGFVFF